MIKRSLFSLVAIVAAYWLYALIAVPLIEPTIDLAQSVSSTDEEREQARNRPDTVHEELRAWFSDRDWELTSKLLFEVGQGILLCKEYENGRDGTLRFKPCTVVLLTDKAGKSIEQWRREAVVVQAEEAVLKFDKPLSLASGTRGNLEGGQLQGKFTIRSDQKEPGPADDLFIMSRDAELSDNRIVTKHPIQFRLGSSYGSGRDVRIDLVPDGNGAFAGVSRLEIKHDVVMHIDMSSMQSGKSSGGEARASSPGGIGGLMGDGKSQPPLQIRSSGPFEFDFAQYVARFRENVDVLRLHPQGQSDSLKGDVLSLYFSPVGDAPAGGKVSKLEPDRIEVRGMPVVMDSPTQQMRARGEHLIYQFGVERITLEGKQPVVVEHEGSRIEAPKLIYEIPPRSARTRFGRFSATGPGNLRAVVPDRPGEVYEAHWKQQALFGPDQEFHIVTLLGDASFRQPQTGMLAGEEIYIWVKEQPAGAPMPLVPDRLLAQGRVKLDSAQLACNVEMLQVWFVADALRRDPRIEELPPPERVSRRDGMLRPVHLATYRQPDDRADVRVAVGHASAGGHGVAPALYSPTPAEGAFQVPPTPAIRPLPPVHGGPPASVGAPTTAARSQSKYTVDGKLLQAELKLVPTEKGQFEAKPSQLRVRENVRVAETVVGQPGEAPLVVKGDLVEFKQTNDHDGTLDVIGEPAHIEGRGTTLEGAVIHMDRATSELHVKSAGTMTLPADRDFEGQSLAQAKPLRVSWLKEMQFDGRVAHFSDDVQADFDGRTLRAHAMDVSFTQRVNFANPAAERPEVADVVCKGRVTIESSTLDEAGQTVSIERMESGELRVNRPTGDVTAEGPGWMKTVRRGGMATPGAAGLQPAGGAQTGLTYVRVDFTTRADGNLNARTMTFGNSVKTIFGPVRGWDQVITIDDLDRLGPDRRPLAQQCGYMQSERLTVAQMRTVDGGTSFEIDAHGNASFEGFNFQNESFLAKGSHIKFAQDKELVVLEGDGRNDAELVRWAGSGQGGQRATSRKIDFWLANSTRPPRVVVDGARHLDVTMPPGGVSPQRAVQPPFVGQSPVSGQTPGDPQLPSGMDYSQDQRFGAPGGPGYSGWNRNP